MTESVGILRGLRFALERWVQKGVLFQLLAVATLIALVAVVGGVVAWSATSAFGGPGEAIWWSFLRLTDPGYLGDDEGATLRVISTVVTVLGYVLFMGSMIAIMTQWLAVTMRRFESGLTPIRMKDHVLVLGWTNRTPETVLALLSARGRLERFLSERGANKLRIVVLSDEVGAERRQELRDELGPYWSESQIFLRSGSSLQPEHLRRLDLANASTVIVPGADFELGGAEASDTRVVKTFLTVNSLLRETAGSSRPRLVGEVFDPLKVSLATSTVDESVEVVASDGLIGRILSQSIRHRGLAQVLFRILSHRQGNSIYLRSFPQLAGRPVYALHEVFPTAIVMGRVHGEGAERRTDLDARSDAVLEADDLLVLLAETYAACVPSGAPEPAASLAAPIPLQRPIASEVHRVLVLGWTHKVGSLAVELSASLSGRFELTVMSRVDAAEREHWLRRVDLSDGRVDIRHVDADYALESDLVAVEPQSFHSVVFLASDWMPSSREADARTILGYVQLRQLLKDEADPPEILIEFLDAENAHLFGSRDDVHLVSPQVLSYLLAHIALRPDLNAVFDELFGAGGSEIDLVPAGALGVSGRPTTFPEVQRAALARGVVALGLLPATGEVELNPDRGRTWTLGEADGVVVLSTVEG